MRRLALPLIALAALSACGGADDGAADAPTLREPESRAEADELAAPPGEEAERARRDDRAAGGGSGARSGAGGDGVDEAPGAEGGAEESHGESGGVRRAGPLTAEGRREIAAVRRALEEFIRRLNARDASVCTELVTANYLRETTGLGGGAAVRKCRRDIARAGGPRIRLGEIDGVRVEGRRALIQFASSVGDLARRQTLRLARGGGRWLVDGDGSRDARG